MTLSTLYLENYSTIVYEGHAGLSVSTVGLRVEGGVGRLLWLRV